MATRQPAWVAQGYNVGTDAASPTWTGENTAASVARGSNFRLRVRVGETNDATVNNVGSWVLQYSVDGAAFASVGAATDVKYVDSAHITDGATGFTGTLTDISLALTYQSTWNEYDENNSVASQTWNDEECEYEYALALNGPTGGQQVTFRMLSPQATAITFGSVPTVNVTGQTVTATGAATLPLPTASGEGQVGGAATHEGTGAVTLPLITASGSGQQIYDFGWFPRSFTNGSPIAYDAWAHRRGAWYGDGAATLPAVTASGSGTVTTPGTTHEATGAGSLPALTASGSATYWTTLAGTGAATLPVLTASGEGTTIHVPDTWEGTGAATLPLLTVAADASFWSTLTATGEPTLPLITASGSGFRFQGRTGSGAATLPLLTASGVGEIIDLWGGTGAPSLPLLTASGTGTRTGTRTGSGAATLPMILAAGSGLPREPTIFSASVALTLPLISVEGLGFQRYRDEDSAHVAYDLALIMFDPSDSAIVQVVWSSLSTGIESVTYTLPTGLTQVDGGLDNSRDPRISRVKISGAVHGYVYPCVATATLQDSTTATVRFTIRGFNA